MALCLGASGAGARMLVASGVLVVMLKMDCGLACRCRAEVIVVCDGIIGHRYYLSSGLFQSFGPT